MSLKEIYSGSAPDSTNFLSVNTKQLYNAVRKNSKNKHITQPKVKRFLQGQDPYTLNRSVIRNFKRNHYYVYYINDLWQMDLADVSAYAEQNDGYKYILTVIDVLTKYAYAVPLRDKSATSVVKAFRTILDSGHGSPKIVSSDKGKEFKNKYMTSLLKSRNIRQQFLLTSSPFKASCVEIWNKTLKSRLFRYFTLKGRTYRRYIDVLDQIVRAYNNTVHSVTRMKPSAVLPKHVPFIYHNTHLKHRDVKAVRSQKLQPGDYVRVVNKKTSFTQTFTEKWSREISIVAKVINKQPYKLYRLKDFKDVELNGKFYDSELQRVHLSPDHVIKIIKSAGIGKKNMFY